MAQRVGDRSLPPTCTRAVAVQEEEHIVDVPVPQIMK